MQHRKRAGIKVGAFSLRLSLEPKWMRDTTADFQQKNRKDISHEAFFYFAWVSKGYSCRLVIEKEWTYLLFHALFSHFRHHDI